jgi:signal transduction histidine kinase/ligand-binding sensor domain-containing protein/CheY-like chemotaxis protein
MYKVITPAFTLLAIFTLASCGNQAGDTPFPHGDSLHQQPVSQALQLGKPRKINWLSVKSEGIKPETKKLDLSALPAVPFDTTGYKPLVKTPQAISFSVSNLPSLPLNLEKIPSLPISFKKYVLPMPVLVKAARLTPRPGTPISISEIGLAQGLPEKIVVSLTHSSDGSVWIGTEKGLYRYDGDCMQVYSTLSLPIAGLKEDPQGRIWYIAPDGIGVLDIQNGLSYFSTEIRVNFPALPRMITDAGGQIWLTHVASKGVDIIDPKNFTYKHLDEKSGLSGADIWGVYEDEKKNIWLTSLNNGANIINPARDKILSLKKNNGLASDSLRAITGDRRGQIWIAYRGGGITEVNPDKGTITNIGKDQGMESNATYTMLYDSAGVLWIATNSGLYALNPEKNLFKLFRESEGVPADFVLDLVNDQRGRLWVATYSGGLSVIESQGIMIHPVGVKQISTLMEDEEGRIWVGAGNNNSDGIQILDFKKKQATQFNKKHGLADNFIQNIMMYKDEIWVASDGGFDRIHPKQKILEHFGKAQGLASDTVYGTLQDKYGNLWISGPAGGVDRIGADKSFQHLGKKEGLSEDNVIDIKADSRGRIWIATNNKGVEVLDSAQGTVQNLNQGPGLRDTCFRSLMPDASGNMWIGTDKGIYIADLQHNTLTIVSEKEGLSDNYITSMLPYQGKMIVGTRNRASIVSPPASIKLAGDSGDTGNRWDVGILEGSEGLAVNSNSWNTNTITRSGQYYWGDVGITIINSIREQKTNAPTYITGLSVMNEPKYFANPIRMGEKDTVWTTDSFYLKGHMPALAGFTAKYGIAWDSVSGPFNLPVNLVLPHDQNYLLFHFAQANLGRPDATLYSYILEGIDKKWSPVSSNTSTENYLNLPPGSYTFKVRSIDEGGHWGKIASFSFTVAPPWWQTWWMYILYAIGVVGTIYGYNKYRSKALVNANRLLEEKVEARTKEVKQQADELTTINQISQALVGQADLKDLIQLVGNELRDLFKANIVYIALLDSKTKMINFPYQYGDNMKPLKLGEGLTSKIILTGEALLINQDVHAHTSHIGIDRVGIPSASYLGVPIPVSDEIIGVLSIQSTEEENRFAEKDKHLLATIAANVGVAIRKARLFEEVKLANTEADSARKTAEEANAAKSAFLSTVSHELRTPLTSVLGFAKITKKRLEEKIFPITDKSDPKTIKTIDQISGNLDVVIAEGERLTNLINDVLDLAKIEAGKMEWNTEPVQMQEVMERAIASTSSLFEQKNLVLERKIDANLPEINADKDKMIQVVVNLLSNAVKFTNSGTVTCSAVQKDGTIVVGITDTGIGIAPGDHGKVFEQFKQVGDTLTDKPKGTGLGLPICKEIVEHHGGHIWLESELGKGSTFYFMLPVIKADEPGTRTIQFNDLLKQLKKRVEQSHPSIIKEHATILVVDDDDGIRSLLKQELGEAGYHIEEAPNGKEALAKVRAVRPDLIVLDVMMPEMNGFDVAAVLKNDPQTMDIPIIILSIVQDKARGFRIGVDRYLTKPIDTDLLFSEIGHLLEQGKSKKKVMVVDEDSVTVRVLTDVLEAKGYQVVESDGKELMEKAVSMQPDIIILNSVISDKNEIVKSLRFEKGLENVLFLIYQ